MGDRKNTRGSHDDYKSFLTEVEKLYGKYFDRDTADILWELAVRAVISSLNCSDREHRAKIRIALSQSAQTPELDAFWHRKLVQQSLTENETHPNEYYGYLQN
ncbi:hypothetical protein PVAG01_08731 [Phlyctema vagabunda]|uniref:Uncharacterized protein n=1 Tax=Phlyctema vagabunda TaxID=108571 RepID=A0ABR4PAP8_9HELO